MHHLQKAETGTSIFYSKFYCLFYIATSNLILFPTKAIYTANCMVYIYLSKRGSTFMHFKYFIYSTYFTILICAEVFFFLTNLCVLYTWMRCMMSDNGNSEFCLIKHFEILTYSICTKEIIVCLILWKTVIPSSSLKISFISKFSNEW